MIQANELRIKNKVQDGNGFIFDVVSIHDDGTVYCDFKGNEGGVWEFDKNNPCQGISLTEEILLKCEGFNRSSDRLFTFNLFDETDRYLEFLITVDKTCLCVLNFIENNNCASLVLNTNIKLHELQNLIFALTNEGLQINL